MSKCENCKFHRYTEVRYGKTREFIAYPVNSDYTGTGELCRKHKNCSPECQDFRHWDQPNRRKRFRKPA